MATQTDVRRIALSLPGTIEGKDHFAFSVRNKGKDKGYAWVWLERFHPKKARVPNPKVLAVRVADLEEKDILLGADESKFFTEPHYNGFPAILVRLASVRAAELRVLLTAAWRCQAPVALVERFDVTRSRKRAAPASARRRDNRRPARTPAAAKAPR